MFARAFVEEQTAAVYLQHDGFAECVGRLAKNLSRHLGPKIPQIGEALLSAYTNQPNAVLDVVQIGSSKWLHVMN